MLVSIIIINYNTFDITCNCIKSIMKYTTGVDYEIILVDNASSKDNADDFLKKFPTVKLIKSPTNGGFAKGNNLGISHAEGDIILLLNSDTYLTEDSISISAKHLQTHPDQILSPKLVYENGSYQKNARKFRSIRNELLDLIRPLLLLIPYRYRAQLMLNQYFKGDFDTYCDWVSGAYMMFYKTHLNLLINSKLDERFFMYGEDHLWCYQFAEQNIKSYFLSSTSVVHIANASTEPTKRLKIMNISLDHELAIMAYRKGKKLYYYTFKLIYSTKELIRYYITTIALKIFKKRIR